MLLHDVKNEDGIRLFFLDVWESYVKVSISMLVALGGIEPDLLYRTRSGCSEKGELMRRSF
jgi:hypothetical protein